MKMNRVSWYRKHLDAAMTIDVMDGDFSQPRNTDWSERGKCQKNILKGWMEKWWQDCCPVYIRLSFFYTVNINEVKTQLSALFLFICFDVIDLLSYCCFVLVLLLFIQLFFVESNLANKYWSENAGGSCCWVWFVDIDVVVVVIVVVFVSLSSLDVYTFLVLLLRVV